MFASCLGCSGRDGRGEFSYSGSIPLQSCRSDQFSSGCKIERRGIGFRIFEVTVDPHRAGNQPFWSFLILFGCFCYSVFSWAKGQSARVQLQGNTLAIQMDGLLQPGPVVSSMMRPGTGVSLGICGLWVNATAIFAVSNSNANIATVPGKPGNSPSTFWYGWRPKTHSISTRTMISIDIMYWVEHC